MQGKNCAVGEGIAGGAWSKLSPAEDDVSPEQGNPNFAGSHGWAIIGTWNSAMALGVLRSAGQRWRDFLHLNPIGSAEPSFRKRASVKGTGALQVCIVKENS